jgi:hypothetical protein
VESTRYRDLEQARAHPEKYPWVTQLLARKPAKVAAVALANKTARIAWAVLTKKEVYRVRPIAATPAYVRLKRKRLGDEE